MVGILTRSYCAYRWYYFDKNNVMVITVEVTSVNFPTFNQFYAQGIKIKRRADMVWKWKAVLCHAIRQQFGAVHYEAIKKSVKPLYIEVIISFKKRAYDVDNCVMYGKLFLDSLKAVEAIKDDSPKYIAKISYEINLACKENKAIYRIHV